MNQRGNRSGWIITALIVVAVVMFKSRMVPNILVPYAPQISGTDYRFTPQMKAPVKTGQSWVLSRRGDGTQYVVEVYTNQSPVRAFATVRGTEQQTPGHQYPCNGTLKINGLEYEASTLTVNPDGKTGTITFVPVKASSSKS